MCSLRLRGTALCQSSLPVRRSSANVNRLSADHAVKKMCFSVSTGEDFPVGSSVFQTTFFAGPNSSGRASAEPTPELFGPRNPGQFAAVSVEAAIAKAATKLVQNERITKLLLARIPLTVIGRRHVREPMQPVKPFPVGTPSLKAYSHSCRNRNRSLHFSEKPAR